MKVAGENVTVPHADKAFCLLARLLWFVFFFFLAPAKSHRWRQRASEATRQTGEQQLHEGAKPSSLWTSAKTIVKLQLLC